MIAGMTTATDYFDHSLHIVEQNTVDDMWVLLNRLELFQIRELSLITATKTFVMCET